MMQSLPYRMLMMLGAWQMLKEALNDLKARCSTQSDLDQTSK